MVYIVFKLNGCIFIFILISNKRTILNKKIEEAVAIDAPIIPCTPNVEKGLFSELEIN